MARGIRASPTETALPKPSFQKVEDESTSQPAGIHNSSAQAYGYNDGSVFQRPRQYIRYIEPLESELAVQVEYDMDEQDQEWLDVVNTERKKEQLDKASYELFEVVMDRLEKEWFDLTKNIPKLDFALPSEDSTCAICDDSEGENSNAIVFCDGCNLAVHQDCYGVPYIPEGQWLCRKCTVSPENPVSCILCPNEGGAFKQTVQGEWVHLLCAIWVPETRVANDVFMEPVTGVERISKQRWKLRCSICDIKTGACIQCAKTSCFIAFHVTCARNEKLLLPMKTTPGSEPVTLTCYCERHLPREQQEARAIAFEAEANESSNGADDGKLSKSARAYAKTFKLGPPLVPFVIVDRIMKYTVRLPLRKKQEFILMVCRYWSLKREARRGAPLLKRLHLEPWTANNALRQHSDGEKQLKLEFLEVLRRDLDCLRSLTELARKREKCKRFQAIIMNDMLEKFLFSHEPALRLAFEKIMILDRNGYFKNPVSKAEVPDYFDIVKQPMCWNLIDAKLDRHEYWDVKVFKDDINLVLSNAILYNKPNTPFHRAAVKIRTSAQPILDELDRLSSVRSSSEAVEEHMDVDSTSSTLSKLGDLEPPLDILDLLLSSETIKDDMNLELDEDPLSYLFSYKFATFKPRPPPRPSAPPRRKPLKPKRDRTEEYARRKLARKLAALEAEKDKLDSSPGFRAPPRTRRAVAAAAAFEAEACADTSGDTEAILPPADVSIYQESGSEPTAPPGETEDRTGSEQQQGLRPHVPSGDVAAPLMVDHVDSQGSFKMFNVGWILPSSQRRGGRAPIDKQPLPPPRKKGRSNQEPLQTSPMQAEASQSLPDDIATLPGPSELPTATDSDHPSTATDPITASITQLPPLPASAPLSVPQPLTNLIPPSNIVKSPNGTIIIEELDTPAIRSEKNKRRKAEKLRLAQVVAASTSALPPVPQSARVPGAAAEDSGLSSLSDVSSEEEGESQKKAVTTQGLAAPQQETLPEEMKPGKIVWAKADTYPWWPATIHEEREGTVPPGVLKQAKKVHQRRKGVVHLVQFFDKQNSWQWIPTDKLKLFGVDKYIDQEFLQRQKWKSPQARAEFRDDYRRALAAFEAAKDGAVEDAVKDEKTHAEQIQDQ